MSLDKNFVDGKKKLTLYDEIREINAPQSKIFINGVLQAIEMFYMVLLWKILPGTKKEGRCQVQSRGGGEFFLESPQGNV